MLLRSSVFLHYITQIPYFSYLFYFLIVPLPFSVSVTPSTFLENYDLRCLGLNFKFFFSKYFINLFIIPFRSYSVFAKSTVLSASSILSPAYRSSSCLFFLYFPFQIADVHIEERGTYRTLLSKSFSCSELCRLFITYFTFSLSLLVRFHNFFSQSLFNSNLS